MLQISRIDVKTGQTLQETIEGVEQPKQKNVEHSYLEHWLQSNGIEAQFFTGKFYDGVNDADRQRLEAEGKVIAWTNGKDAYFSDPETVRLMTEGDSERGINPIYAPDRNSAHNLVAYGSLVASDGTASTSLPQARILVVNDEQRSVGDQPLLDQDGNAIAPEQLEKLLDKMGDGTMLVSSAVMQSLVLQDEKDEIATRVFKKAGISEQLEDLATADPDVLSGALDDIERQTAALARRTVTQFRAATPDLPGVMKGTVGSSQWCERLGVDAIISSNDIKGDDGRLSTPGIQEISGLWINRKSDATYGKQAVGPQVKGCIPEATLHEFNPRIEAQATELASVIGDPIALSAHYIEKKDKQQAFLTEGEPTDAAPERSDWLYDVLKADPYGQLSHFSKINRELDRFSKGQWVDQALHGVSVPSAMAQNHAALHPWEVCNKDLPHGAIVAYYRSPFPNVGAAAIAINNTENLKQADPEAFSKHGVAYLPPWTAKNIAITDFDRDANGYFDGYHATVPDLPQQVREQLASVTHLPPAQQYEAGRALFEQMIHQAEAGQEDRITPATYPVAVKEFVERNAPDQKPPEITKDKKVKHPWNEGESHSEATWRAWTITADNPTGKVANAGMTLQSLALEIHYAPQEQKERLLKQVSDNCRKQLGQANQGRLFIPDDEWLQEQGFPEYHFRQRIVQLSKATPQLAQTSDPNERKALVDTHLENAYRLMWDITDGPNARNLQTAVDTAKSSRGIDEGIHTFAMAMAHKTHELRKHYKDADLYLHGKELPTNTQEPIGWGVEAVNALYHDTTLPELKNEAFRDVIPKDCTPAQEAQALTIAQTYNGLVQQAIAAKDRLREKHPEDQQPTLTMTTPSGHEFIVQNLQDPHGELPIWRASGNQPDWKVTIEQDTQSKTEATQFPVHLDFVGSNGDRHTRLLGYVAPESVEENHLAQRLQHQPDRLLVVEAPTAEIRPPFAQQNDVDETLARASEYARGAVAQIPKEERLAYVSALWHQSHGMGFALKHFTPEVCDRLQTVPEITLTGIQRDTNEAGAIAPGEYTARFSQYSYVKDGETRTVPSIAIVDADGDEKQFGALSPRSVHLPLGTTVQAQITIQDSGKVAKMQVLGVAQSAQSAEIAQDLPASDPNQAIAQQLLDFGFEKNGAFEREARPEAVTQYDLSTHNGGDGIESFRFDAATVQWSSFSREDDGGEPVEYAPTSPAEIEDRLDTLAPWKAQHDIDQTSLKDWNPQSDHIETAVQIGLDAHKGEPQTTPVVDLAQHQWRVADAGATYPANSQPLTIVAKGACAGQSGGWGAILVQGDTYREIGGRSTDSTTTVNRMAMTSATEALNYARQNGLLEGSPSVQVLSDSQVFVGGANGGKKKANLDLWADYQAAADGVNLKVEWVSGASEQNKQASAIANGFAKGKEVELHDTPPERRRSPAVETPPRAPGAEAKPLTDEQTIALGKLQAWIKDDSAPKALLTGYAGTGKTHLLCHFLESEGLKKVAVVAPTNKAAGVAEDMLREQGIGKGIEVTTVHSLLGLKQQVDPSTGDVTFAPDRSKPKSVSSFDLVVVDEASMLNGELHDHLERAPKVLYVGDPAQLPPVGEAQSPVFADPAIPEKYAAHLSNPVRYGGPIGEAALSVRSDLSASERWQFPTSDDRSVQSAKPGEWLATSLEKVKEGHESGDPNHCRMLAYTNKRVDELNAAARTHLFGPDAPAFVPGERLIVRSPVVRDDEIALNTSDEVKVLSVKEDTHADLPVWKVKVAGDTVDPKHGRITLNILKPEATQEFDQRLDTLRQAAMSSPDKSTWGAYYDFKGEFDSVRPAYALTIHNSQGSTFTHVAIDLDNVYGTVASQLRARPEQADSLIETRNRLLYTGMTRGKESLLLADSRVPELTTATVTPTPQSQDVPTSPQGGTTQFLQTDAAHCLYRFVNNDACDSYKPTTPEVQQILDAAAGRGLPHRCEWLAQGNVRQVIASVDFPDTTALREFEQAIAPLPIQSRYEGELSGAVQFIEPQEQEWLNETGMVPIPDEATLQRFEADPAFVIATGNDRLSVSSVNMTTQDHSFVRLPDLMMLDIDKPVSEVIKQFQSRCEKHSNELWAIHFTQHGAHAIRLDEPRTPSQVVSHPVMETLGVDKNYLQMCAANDEWTARITPKSGREGDRIQLEQIVGTGTPDPRLLKDLEAYQQLLVQNGMDKPESLDRIQQLSQTSPHTGPSQSEEAIAIAGKPVKMVYDLQLNGNPNPLPVDTCFDAMRGYGRCHTTRSFEPHAIYGFTEGDVAIAYSGDRQVAFQVGEQYRITPEMMADPAYQQQWAAMEKHDGHFLQQAFEGKEAWGLKMEPLGDYVNGKIEPFPDRSSEIYSPSRQELRQWCTAAAANGDEPLKGRIIDIGTQLKTLYGAEVGEPGATPPPEYRHPQVVVSEGDRQQMQQDIGEMREVIQQATAQQQTRYAQLEA